MPQSAASTNPATPASPHAPKQSAPAHVVILGGGVSGLTIAYRLLFETKEPLRVTLVEANRRLGGNIHSQREDGFVVEHGPNGFLSNVPATLELCAALGLRKRLVSASREAATRYVYARGKLHALPTSPLGFLTSGLLSVRGRLRVFCEPFVPARPRLDESVFDFASRRIGREAASILVDAMVSGVFAGDPSRLSVVSAFNKLHVLERDHGGLVRGMLAKMLAKRRERRIGHEPVASGRAQGPTQGPAGPGGTLTSLDLGFEVLIEALGAALDGHEHFTQRTETRATALVRTATSSASGAWTIQLGRDRPLEADAVVVAIPCLAAATLLDSLAPDAANTLRTIESAPLAVVALGYRKEHLDRPLDGFGFLIPRGQGPRTLGVLWDSSVYPNRAPEGWALMRAMIGGSRDREACSLPDDELVSIVRADIATATGQRQPPDRTWVFRHPVGIPQYTLGHADRLVAIDRAVADLPGLHLAGNTYRGVSVNHCIADSKAVTARVRAAFGGCAS